MLFDELKLLINANQFIRAVLECKRIKCLKRNTIQQFIEIDFYNFLVIAKVLQSILWLCGQHSIIICAAVLSAAFLFQ